jgi:hypothetical protein
MGIAAMAKPVLPRGFYRTAVRFGWRQVCIGQVYFGKERSLRVRQRS